MLPRLFAATEQHHRRLVTLLNYYRMHIPDDVGTYIFTLYVNYDLLTQWVELG